MSDKTIYQGLGQLGLQTAIPASPEAAVLERVVNPHEDTLYLTQSVGRIRDCAQAVGNHGTVHRVIVKWQLIAR